MATVLTRLISPAGRFLQRQQRRDINVSPDYRDTSATENMRQVENDRGEPRRKRAKVESDADEDNESEIEESVGEEESEDEAAITEVVDGEQELSRTSRTITLRNPRRKVGNAITSRRSTRGRAVKTDTDEDDEEEEEEERAEERTRDRDRDGDRDSSASSGSDSNEHWHDESDAAEEAEIEEASPNCCIFCGADEEHDPSEDFEEYLACSDCGKNGRLPSNLLREQQMVFVQSIDLFVAHSHCARGSEAFSSGQEASGWRCPDCNENVETDVEPAATSSKRRKSDVSKMTRELFPSFRGTIKPGSHSVFNNLIVDGDTLDGSRSLRKRKSSDESEGKPRPEPRKKVRRSTSEVDPLATDGAALVDGKLEPLPEVVEATTGEQEAKASPRSRTVRTRPHRGQDRPLVRVVTSNDQELVVAFSADPTFLANLDNEKRKRLRRERDRARRQRRAEQAEVEVPVSHYPAIQTANFPAPFYAFHEREGDESKSKPYGGILSEAEADTSKTFPQAADRKLFEDARQKAEEEWKKKMEAASQTDSGRPVAKVSGPPSKIKCINFGKYEIDTWHAAPYPEEYSRNRVLYICEFCLKYMSSDFVAWRHKLKCPAKHPPGDEIYRDGNFSFFEVDGRKNPVYCQNLCLLAKLFLGSKTLYYDVEPFLFYIMTEYDEFGMHFVGYFSKEKRPSSLNNVSCILVLPIHQRRGFGHMLIDFSYLLTKVEKKTGSPEKPLSDMGLVSYRSYWRLVLCQELLNQKTPLSITDLSKRTGMTADDIVCALEGLRALVRDPVTKTYALRLDYDFFKQYIDNYEKKGYTKIKPEALSWVPYVMGRDNMHYENTPHISTVAQREEVQEDIMPEEGVQLDMKNLKLQPEATKDGDDAMPDVPTPQEDDGKAIPDAPTTPHSSFNSMSNRISPSKKSPPKSTSVASPLEPTSSEATIPPTRFEVFPPLPGNTTRKAGRPFGRRVTSRRSTPARRSTTQENAITPRAPGTGTMPTSARRTRSNLAETVVNGVSDGGESDDREEPSPKNGADLEDPGVDEGTPNPGSIGHEEDSIMEDA